jgi:hypothetical protein
MKDIRIFGLCLAVTFALSAMAASSAFAGEYITCVKVAKENKEFHGRYTDKTCGVLSPTSTGRYERGSPTFPVTFTSKTATVDWRSAAGAMDCKASTGTGEILGSKANLEETTFTQCELSILAACTNLSIYEETGKYSPSEITVLSSSELVDHGEKGPSGLEPAEGEVWNAFSADPESALYPYQAVWVCEPGIIFRMSGSMSGVVSPVNAKASKKGTLTFGEGKGEQDLVTEYSENGGLTWEPTGPNVLTEAASIKYASDVEVTPFAP